MKDINVININVTHKQGSFEGLLQRFEKQIKESIERKRERKITQIKRTKKVKIKRSKRIVRNGKRRKRK